MSSNQTPAMEHFIHNVKDDMTKSQLKMSRAIAERQVAIQVAATRERLGWFVPMMAISIGFLHRAYNKTKASVVLYPLIPMSFAFFYQVDFAYGSKIRRVKDLTDNILKNESYLLTIPELPLASNNKITQETVHQNPSNDSETMPRLIRNAHCDS